MVLQDFAPANKSYLLPRLSPMYASYSPRPRRRTLRSLIESLSNDDGNVNENVEKQWIKLQNTITARGNATTCPLFRRRL